jgi:AcrR family transcriptional regulator
MTAARSEWTETESEILEATFRALCEHGYADLTLRKIAAEFEKSRALIYQHYRSKEELFAALVQYLIDQYEEYLDVESGGDPRARLDRYIEVGLFGPDDPDFDHWAFHTALLEFRVQGHHNEELRDHLVRSYERVLDIVEDVIRDGVRQGVFRDVDRTQAAQLLVGVIDAARMLRIVGVDDDAPEAFHDAIHAFVLPNLYVDPPESSSHP